MANIERISVFAINIAEYDHLPRLDDLDQEVALLVGLLEGFGGTLTRRWDTPMEHRGADEINDRLSSWSKSSDGPSILYWVGHGWSDGIDAALAHVHSPMNVAISGVHPRTLALHIAQWESNATDDPWLIVIVDACKSKRFAELLHGELLNLQTPGRVLIIGTSSDGATTVGRFRRALGLVLGVSFAADDIIDFARFWAEVKRTLPGCAALPMNVENAAFQRTVASPAGLKVPLDVRTAVLDALTTMPEDDRRHFIPKAQGAELGEVSWYFEGREFERQQVSEWLQTNQGGMFIITGRAGAGKSALLGDILIRSRPELNRVLLGAGLLVPINDQSSPPPNAFDAALHLTGFTANDAVDRLIKDLGLRQISSGTASLSERISDLLVAVREQRGNATVLVDALDESADPILIAESVLRALSDLAGVRVIVGTRRSTLEGPDSPIADSQNLIDALTNPDRAPRVIQMQRDPGAISRYVARRLSAGTAGQAVSPNNNMIQEVAALIASRDREFLFARLAVHEILANPQLLSDRWTLNVLLDGNHRTIFASSVDRLKRIHPSYGALFLALALSQGRGLPVRDGIWKGIASAIQPGSGDVTDLDVSAFVADSAPYLMLDREHGQTVYRLAHRTFAEHFSASTSNERELEQILGYCLQVVDASDQVELNSYLVAYTATHASACGERGWLRLADHTSALDHLDAGAVAGEALRTAFGRFKLPAEISAIIASQHQLRDAATGDRAGLRQLAMCRSSSRVQPGLSQAGPLANWGVEAADFELETVHLTMIGHIGSVKGLCTIPVPGGRTLVASAGEDGTIRFWDPLTGGAVGEPRSGHLGSVNGLCPLPIRDSRHHVASAGADGSVRIWDPVTGRQMRDPLIGHTGSVQCICTVVSPTGTSLLVTGGEDGTLRIWNAITGHEVCEPLFGHAGPVRAVCTCLTASGRTLLVSGGDDHVFRVWEPWNGLLVTEQTLEEPSESRGLIGIRTLCDLSTIGLTGMVAVGTADGLLEVRDVPTGRAADVWADSYYRRDVRSVCVVPAIKGRRSIAYGGTDGKLRHHDAQSEMSWGYGETLGEAGSAITVLCALTMPDGQILLASGGSDGALRIWDFGTTATSSAHPGSSGDVIAVSAAPQLDGLTTVVIAGRTLPYLRAWNPSTGEQLMSPFWGANKVITACSVTYSTSTLVAAALDNGLIQLRNVDSGRPIGHPISGHVGMVRALCATQRLDGRAVLVYGGDDGSVRFWDVQTRLQIATPPSDFLSRHEGPIRALCAFRPVGRDSLIASCGDDWSIRLWDLEARRIGYPLFGHVGAVNCVAGLCGVGSLTRLASGGDDGTVRLWDVRTGWQVGEPLTLHAGPIRGLAGLLMSDGSALLISACSDGELIAWDILNGGQFVASMQTGLTIRSMTPVGPTELAIGSDVGTAIISISMARMELHRQR